MWNPDPWYPGAWFAPPWFATGEPTPPGPGDTLGDTEIYDDIVARLLATTEFKVVEIGRPEEYPSTGQPGKRPAAFVYPINFEEIDNRASQDTSDLDHNARWGLSIICNANRPRERYSACERMYNIAANALDNKSLGNLTWPGKTKLRRGSYARPQPPDQRLDCVGEFYYEMAGFSAHNELVVPRP